VSTKTTPDELSYYRQQCDALGARVIHLQEELFQARRDAQRNRTLALVVQQIHALAQELHDKDDYAERLGEALLMLLVERLKVDAAALLRRTEISGHYRLDQAIGIRPAVDIPALAHPPVSGCVLSASHEIAQATGLTEALWVEAPPSPSILLLGFRRHQAARHKQLDPADSAIAAAAIQVYDGLLGHQAALTALNNSEANYRRLAFFDPLTDLPNRRLFMDRLANAQASVQRHGHIGAVLFLDLDRFKQINDARGHDVGDRLLQQVAGRLQSLLRNEDTVSRFGGDEFAILLANLSREETDAAHFAYRVAEKIRHTLAIPFCFPEGEIDSGISIGVTLLRGGEVSLHDVLREADTALYCAKESGRNCVRVFEKSMQHAVEARFNLSGELKQAFEHRHLTLFYQPQVDAQGRLIGMEALLRWPHPKHGMISPAVFIPVAEDANLILPIGHWVLHQACLFLARISRGRQALRMSVNVSPKQFRQADFVAQVQQALADSGISPECLTLELTEGIVVEDIEGTIVKMRELKMLGMRLSIDDFGTGYSSLTYLKRLPVDELKIDRSFIQDLCSDSSDATLVEAILSVCRHLRVSAVAEGVETEGQLQFLRARHCDTYQGYYFGTPLPAEAFVQRFALQSTASPLVMTPDDRFFD
jgi:diguanylate cyclase (GGDEF)-like protein